MKLRILHRTEYRYALPVRNNANALRVTPLTNLRQKLGLHLVRVLPAVRMRRYPDLYRNHVHLFEIEETHRELIIDVSSIVETTPTPVSAIPTDVPLAAVREEGVIERYAALVSPPALGLVLQAMVQVTLDDHSEKTVEAFEAAIRARPEVVACYAMTGDMDFLLHILVPDLASFSEFAMKALLRMPGVRGTRSSFIMQAVKSDLVWAPQPPASVRR